MAEVDCLFRTVTASTSNNDSVTTALTVGGTGLRFVTVTASDTGSHELVFNNGASTMILAGATSKIFDPGAGIKDSFSLHRLDTVTATNKHGSSAVTFTYEGSI